MSEGQTEIHLLALVIDTTPAKKIASQGASILQRTLDSVISFGNTHLMQSTLNKLVVLACNSSTTKFLYPSYEDDPNVPIQQRPGQYEVFSKVDSLVRHGISQLMLNDHTNHDSTKSDSLLGGAMARALCHIHSVQREMPVHNQLKSRILVISGSSDSALQYMTFMNVFFTAQKENIVIDACMMDADSGLLQQGCDITGGQYLRIPNIAGLMKYLIWVFLPSPACRSKLVLPAASKVDYRAACFCHRQLVDIGYVCSICLSIFCKFSPICTTCHAVFKTNAPPLALKPKKKRTRIE